LTKKKKPASKKMIPESRGGTHRGISRGRLMGVLRVEAETKENYRKDTGGEKKDAAMHFGRRLTKRKEKVMTT